MSQGQITIERAAGPSVERTMSPISIFRNSQFAGPLLKILFDTDPPAFDHLEGLVHWNNADKTLDIHTDIDGTKIQVGQEMVVKAVNKTGSDISDGQAVYISGAQGNRPTITLADADDGTATARTIGLATADIANNAEGYVTVFGLVRDIDTDSFSEGDPLYVSTTPGVLTNVKPTYPSHNMRVGYCVVSHSSNGVVLVTTQKGFHLANLWEVLISGAANGDGLIYDTGQWKNERVLVPENVYDNGIISVDTELDWANGFVQVVTMGAISNLSFTGWGSLAPLADSKAQDGRLIIIDGDLFAPTFDDVNQGPLPTYVAGFANVQELASLGPDGDIYNMWQVSNDQHVLLGPALVTGTDSDMSGPNNWNGSNFTVFDINSTVADKMYFVGDGVNDYAILAGVFTVGATFLIKLKGRLNSGASTELRIGANLGVSAEYLSFTPTGIENTFSGIVTIATGGTMFLGRTGAGFNGVAFEIDDVEIWKLF